MFHVKQGLSSEGSGAAAEDSTGPCQGREGGRGPSFVDPPWPRWDTADTYEYFLSPPIDSDSPRP